MGRLIIVPPLPIAAVVASVGTGAANLLTPAPKEVWIDSASGRAAVLEIDLGAVRSFDTLLLGHVAPPAAAATWSLSTGVAGSAEVAVFANAPLRATDAPGTAPDRTHALWHGATVTARYLRLSVSQPGASPPLSAGVLLVGQAFVAALGQEWGFGRRPIDTGSATPLPSGGFAIVEGARKRALSWTFGDLSIAEADQLERIALDLGETGAVLVVEDPAATPGLAARIHYGLFERWRAFERRNRRQTRWELGLVEWI